MEPNNLKGRKLGSLSLEKGLDSGPHRELRVEFSRCLKLLRLGIVLHSYNLGLLIHCLGCYHICLSLKVEMEFREVKIRV